MALRAVVLVLRVRLRELYPNVNIRLLYNRDYHQLIAAYGNGPGINDAESCPLPSRENVAKYCYLVLTLFFPGFFTSGAVTKQELPEFTKARIVGAQGHDLIAQPI